MHDTGYPPPRIQPTIASLPYPNAAVPVFPGVAPRLMAAIGEAQRLTRAPWELVLIAGLTPLSIALQGLINVEKLGGQSGPVSLLSLIVADSGERKSSVENLLFRSVREFQKVQLEAFAAAKTRWDLQTELWKEERAAKKRAHRQEVKAGRPPAEMIAALLAHEKEKPARPRGCKLIYEDGTIEALLHGMYLESPSAALISSEGGGILDGRIISAMAKLNALWSGDSITVDRKSADSFELIDARLTVGLMVQPSLLEKFVEGRGEEARGSGLLARCLVVRPESTQGTRFADGQPITTHALDDYNDRIKEILADFALCLLGEASSRRVVTFTPEAKSYLLAISNGIEQQINCGGRFYGRGDHASKLTDNITRVAALIHCFEHGYEAPIDTPILNLAISVCFMCSDHFAHVFQIEPQMVMDSRLLEQWFVIPNGAGKRYLRKNHIQQFGPHRIRSKSRLTAALENLDFCRRIRMFKYGKGVVIDTMPGLLFCENRLRHECGPSR